VYASNGRPIAVVAPVGGSSGTRVDAAFSAQPATNNASMTPYTALIVVREFCCLILPVQRTRFRVSGVRFSFAAGYSFRARIYIPHEPNDTNGLAGWYCLLAHEPCLCAHKPEIAVGQDVCASDRLLETRIDTSEDWWIGKLNGLR
jgi:hypothetical protein